MARISRSTIASLLAGLLVICAVPAAAFAAENAVSPVQALAEGRSAINLGMPSLAVIYLRAATEGAEALGSAEAAREAQLLLALAQLHSSQPLDAMATLEQIKGLGEGGSALGEILLHAQTLAALGRWEDALKVSDRIAMPTDPQAAPFSASPRQDFAINLLRGECLYSLGEFVDAEFPLKNALGMVPTVRASTDSASRVKFLLAANTLRLGNPAECLRLLSGLLPQRGRLLGLLSQTTPAAEESFAMPTAAKDVLLLEAEAHAALGDFQLAVNLCALVLRHPGGLSDERRLHAFERKAYYEVLNGRADEAEHTFLQALQENEQPAHLHRIFGHLLALYTQYDLNAKVSLTPFLQGSDGARKPYAEFLTALLSTRAGDFNAASELLGSLLEREPRHALAPDAALLHMRLQRQMGGGDATVAPMANLSTDQLTPEFTRLFAFEAGLALLAQGSYDSAIRQFGEVADAPGTMSIAARYNQGLAALAGERPTVYEDSVTELTSQPAAALHVQALKVAKGAHELRHGRYENARAALEPLLPQQPRATLLMAELELRGKRSLKVYELAQLAGDTPPPDPLPGETATSPQALEQQADYLAFWAAATDPKVSREALITKAQSYLEEHAGTESSELIRFKLAELYFQQSAFAQALREFEVLGEQTKNPELREVAQFQTGRAAALSMSELGLERALEAYTEISAGTGKLRLDALLEKANLLRELGRFEEAIATYKELIAVAPSKSEMALAGLQGQAQCLFTQGTGTSVTAPATTAPSPVAVAPPREIDREKLNQCIEVCEALLEAADGRTAWRNFALYMQGRCAQELGDEDSAFVRFTSAVTQTAAAPSADPEFLWLYRAGFAAVEILEARNQLPTALALLRQLSVAGGPRAQEAAERVKLIQLKNFMWEDPASGSGKGVDPAGE